MAENRNLPPALRGKLALVSDAGTDLPDGFAAYLIRGPAGDRMPGPAAVLPEDLRYLGRDDVVRLSSDLRSLRVLFRAASPHNAFLVTERCDHRCVMCAQPPRGRDQTDLLAETLEVLPLVPRDTPVIGVTGGEPTILGEGFFRLVRAARDHLPDTRLQILTHGRRFRDREFAGALRAIGHRRLTLGIPLYSDQAAIHDWVVQSRGAFDDTVLGLMNLRAEGIPVELRFVIHRGNFRRLPQFAEFVRRTLTFVDHVALMGLELTGYARSNARSLWVDPVDYAEGLERAVLMLARARIAVSVFNHQLCVLRPAVRPYAARAISDWKNEYLEGVCDHCDARHECGGFFSSGVGRASRGIAALGAADRTVRFGGV